MNIESFILSDVVLAKRTTLGIGGRADYLIEIDQLDKLPAAVAWAKQHAMVITVLGAGSNVVIADDGIRGLVLVINVADIQHGEDGQLTISAGMSWSQLVAYCVANELAGIECLSGIPGTVGAAPIQNIGAYGQQLSDVLVSLEAFDVANECFVVFNHADCDFNYRQSRFKHDPHKRYIVTRVKLALTKGGMATIAYPALQQAITEQGINTPSLAQVADRVLAIRQQKSMLIDHADQWARSAGSFFINPILDTAQIVDLQDNLAELGIDYADVPKHLLTNGQIKIFGAWLIEQCGFTRGFRVGDVAISKNHALALVNLDNASASELLVFAKQIQQAIIARFNIHLQMEPRLLGDKHPIQIE